ncbi:MULTISPECIES: flagellar biosynthetic protein FliQ [Dethiosulfovibrio]|jgi:flagellar biosynthetic protein FliQ|uniref:Export protein FliQ family 3 n=3 Tax=Dethiosulfovibrio TaxID=47054 RepID=D2Z3K4_9BACT|nr:MULTISPECIES: flagellar biosynthetic protein FliQ [Dethiosulfovibrio]MEA3284148.1 flagellar biosynthetic protein FliQ [Synergistota bacterium]EFC90310.1 export protein FliQ family 3 [Dethiosulfovibrio peptidovorans DSM 11002]MCF4113978.1 flagellar biosynthetic protein FliQ [Dethiosulfovibrio russensis]MCF4141609.1 flagellar biosynthetic protein FliQ [Dethiosulfovibrio marinus]MCF4143974.1 flagellar biosynthetic protein FliQ [Dethiosulfovibrio acidaminovorans]
MEAFSVSDMLMEAIKVSLMASLPILIVAMVVGLIVGILQTATSIQEQTLSFVPKIIAIMGALVVMGPWIFGVVRKLAVDLLGQLDRFVR